jgi:hypothetical protein
MEDDNEKTYLSATFGRFNRRMQPVYVCVRKVEHARRRRPYRRPSNAHGRAVISK